MSLDVSSSSDFAPTDDLSSEHVHPLSRKAWRAWLKAHHARKEGVWLVLYKKATGKPTLSVNDYVEEAIAFGWIDSTPKKVDAARSACWIAPRKRGSNWSRLSKERAERMEATRADGSWAALDEVENLLMPEDLAAAFEAHPGSAEHWEAFPRSVKRGILEWILNAKRAATRAKRIEETARLAAQNQCANQWPRAT